MNHEEALRRIAQLEAENLKLREQLARAKNPDPVQRPSFERVRRLASNACMDVERVKTGGFWLTFGQTKRWFKRLTEIWEIFIADDFILSDIFSKKVIPDIPKRPKLRSRNASLVPNPNLPDRDSVSHETRTEVGKTKPVYVPAKDRYWEPPWFRTWWYINHDPPPSNQPEDFWHEPSIIPFS